MTRKSQYSSSFALFARTMCTVRPRLRPSSTTQRERLLVVVSRFRVARCFLFAASSPGDGTWCGVESTHHSVAIEMREPKERLSAKEKSDDEFSRDLVTRHDFFRLRFCARDSLIRFLGRSESSERRIGCVESIFDFSKFRLALSRSQSCSRRLVSLVNR